jgi:hypothetical protein
MRMGETARREGMRAFGSVTPQQVVIWEGLDILIAERQRLEMIAWVCDPLPAGIRTAGP